jgi:Zn-dependent oligopeptidase
MQYITFTSDNSAHVSLAVCMHDHKQVSLASKMADDVAAVDKLSEMLRERARPFALKELDDLKAFAGM